MSFLCLRTNESRSVRLANFGKYQSDASEVGVQVRVACVESYVCCVCCLCVVCVLFVCCLYVVCVLFVCFIACGFVALVAVVRSCLLTARRSTMWSSQSSPMDQSVCSQKKKKSLETRTVRVVKSSTNSETISV